MKESLDIERGGGVQIINDRRICINEKRTTSLTHTLYMKREERRVQKRVKSELSVVGGYECFLVVL